MWRWVVRGCLVHQRGCVMHRPSSPWAVISGHFLFCHEGGKRGRRDIAEARSRCISGPDHECFLQSPVTQSGSPFYQFRIKLGKVWKLRRCRIGETGESTWCESWTAWTDFVFSWTRASSNRITSAIIHRPSLTGAFFCIYWLTAHTPQVILSFLTNSRNGVTVSEIHRQDQHKQILPKPSRSEPSPRARCGGGEGGGEPATPASASVPSAARGRGCKKLNMSITAVVSRLDRCALHINRLWNDEMYWL